MVLWVWRDSRRLLQPQEITDYYFNGTACGGTTPQTGATTWYTDLQLFWGANATQTQGGNNGNLQGQLINTCNSGTNQSFWETFQYDGVNRITTFTDNGAGNNERDFGYDPYGNMWVTGNSNLPYNSTTPTSNVYNAANQRTDSGYTYDGAGNQTSIGNVCPGSTCVQYDAENRQVSFGISGATYQYDGDGHRVASTISGVTTIYVYDAQGQLAAQYSSGSQAIPPCQTCYLSWDHLGSTRLVTDQNGNVVSRHDYLPFGEEITSGFAGRGSQWGNTDNVSQKFTGKERDAESGLDYFGARYYGSALGRWTSPDSSGSSSWTIMPESSNG